MDNFLTFWRPYGKIRCKSGSKKEHKNQSEPKIRDALAQEGQSAPYRVYCAARVEEKRFVSVEQIFQNAKRRKEEPFIILLNGIEDPHNFGAILRSAEGAGAHGIIIPKRRTAPIGATVAKTSAGALYHIPIARVANISQTVMKLKEKGVWIVGSDSSSDKMYYDVDFTLPIAIILGNEGKGMQDIVRKKCDFIVNEMVFM